MNSLEYRRLGIAKMKAIIQQATMVMKALFRVERGKKGLTIARYLLCNNMAIQRSTFLTNSEVIWDHSEW